MTNQNDKPGAHTPGQQNQQTQQPGQGGQHGDHGNTKPGQHQQGDKK